MLNSCDVLTALERLYRDDQETNSDWNNAVCLALRTVENMPEETRWRKLGVHGKVPEGNYIVSMTDDEGNGNYMSLATYKTYKYGSVTRYEWHNYSGEKLTPTLKIVAYQSAPDQYEEHKHAL